MRTAADGVGAREWLEMGGEKKPLVMSELGCADGCGRQMGAENYADGCGRRGCKGVAGNGWGEEAAGDERARLRGRLRTARTAADSVGAREKWVGRRSRVMSELLRGRLRTGNGCGEVRTARRLEMGGEKKPLVMSELGCADGCADGCGRES